VNRRQHKQRHAVGNMVQSFFLPHKSKATPRPVVTVPPRGIGPVLEPNKNDVLCGRGGKICSYSGNIQFRDIVNKTKDHYLAKSTKKMAKAHIAAKIVHQIRSMVPPGRFLKEDKKGGPWYDIGDERAIKKVCQALRESETKQKDAKITSEASSESGKSMTSIGKNIPPQQKQQQRKQLKQQQKQQQTSPQMAISVKPENHTSAPAPANTAPVYMQQPINTVSVAGIQQASPQIIPPAQQYNADQVVPVGPPPMMTQTSLGTAQVVSAQHHMTVIPQQQIPQQHIAIPLSQQHHQQQQILMSMSHQQHQQQIMISIPGQQLSEQQLSEQQLKQQNLQLQQKNQQLQQQNEQLQKQNMMSMSLQNQQQIMIPTLQQHHHHQQQSAMPLSQQQQTQIKISQQLPQNLQMPPPDEQLRLQMKKNTSRQHQMQQEPVPFSHARNSNQAGNLNGRQKLKRLARLRTGGNTASISNTAGEFMGQPGSHKRKSNSSKKADAFGGIFHPVEGSEISGFSEMSSVRDGSLISGLSSLTAGTACGGARARAPFPSQQQQIYHEVEPKFELLPKQNQLKQLNEDVPYQHSKNDDGSMMSLETLSKISVDMASMSINSALMQGSILSDL